MRLLPKNVGEISHHDSFDPGASPVRATRQHLGGSGDIVGSRGLVFADGGGAAAEEVHPEMAPGLTVDGG